MNDNTLQVREVGSQQLLFERVIILFGIDVNGVEFGTNAALETVEAVVLPLVIAYG